VSASQERFRPDSAENGRDGEEACLPTLFVEMVLDRFTVVVGPQMLVD